MSEPTAATDNGYAMWCVNGRLHRLDGPAVTDADGYKAWYVDDIACTEADYPMDLMQRVKAWFTRSGPGLNGTTLMYYSVTLGRTTTVILNLDKLEEHGEELDLIVWLLAADHPVNKIPLKTVRKFAKRVGKDWFMQTRNGNTVRIPDNVIGD